MKTVMEMLSLKGKVALVTGSATGIGQAICEGFAEAGGDVVGIYHLSSPGETMKMVEDVGGKFAAVYGDLEQSHTLDEIFKKALDCFGRIDILVNAAMIPGRTFIETFDYSLYEKNVAINQNAMLLLSVAASKYFSENNIKGRIINMASSASFMAYLTQATAYCITKHAVMGITRSMALSLADKGITVNAIAPCMIETRLTLGTPEYKVRNEQLLHTRTPIKRWGQPREIKGAALLLASEAGAFITGQSISVDGGYLIK